MDMQHFLQETEPNAMGDDMDDVRHEEGEEGHNTGRVLGEPSAAEPAPLRPYGNTGPKGVLADHAEHVRQQQVQHEWERQRVNAIAKLNSFAPMTEEERVLAHAPSYQQAVDEVLEDEEAVFQEFLQQRMDQFRKTQMPVFGHVRTLTLETFLPNVDGQHPDVFVAILLTDPSGDTSRTAEVALHGVARVHRHVKCCVAPARSLKPSWDLDLCPSMIVYRGGSLVASLLALTRELGPRFQAKELAELMADNNIVPYVKDWEDKLMESDSLLSQQEDDESDDESDEEDYSRSRGTLLRF